MLLMYKQLVKQLSRNKIFITLLLLLTTLTSLSYFFVIFSIDGNMAALSTLSNLTENQRLYENALNANIFLAYTFLSSTIGLTAFVFVMFFYRFYRSNKRQIGCLKSLGFKDGPLQSCFITFVAILSVIGAVLGLVGGYFLSDVLINANMRTYLVTGLVKEASVVSLIIGFGAPTLIFCVTALLCYSFVHGKEPGELIAANSNHAQFSFSLRTANRISSILPVRNKFPLRAALRKPIAALLIIIAVMSFSVCMIMGYSLNMSSQTVLKSQTTGHNYEYDTKFSEYQTKPVLESVMAYLENPAELIIGRYHIEKQTIVGLYNIDDLYKLQDMAGGILTMMKPGTVYINPGLSDTYGVNVDDTLVVDIGGGKYSFIVSGVAYNAKSTCVYINAKELSEILSVTDGSYNGVLSMEKIIGGETTITKPERIEELDRNAVSSSISAVINQSIGGIVGTVLIFLALYVNFQDNTRDMLILHMMGYRVRNIRKMLIDVYLPIVWAAFIVTLAPSVLLASSIQKSFSVATNEYMPFGTSVIVILIIFIFLNLIYYLVQSLFGLGIKRTIHKDEVLEFVYAE